MGAAEWLRQRNYELHASHLVYHFARRGEHERNHLSNRATGKPSDVRDRNAARQHTMLERYKCCFWQQLFLSRRSGEPIWRIGGL